MLLHAQEVADYDFVELLTDIIYILATVGAPPQLTAIVAHDYGMMGLLTRRACHASTGMQLSIPITLSTQQHHPTVLPMMLQVRHWAHSWRP
jgi:hypothetical protein